MLRNLLLATLTLAAAQLGLAADPTPTLSLTATGTVKVKPDQGYITLGVTTVKPTTADALAENTKATKAIFATLAAKGVKDEDIQTVDFSVSEHYASVIEKDETGKPYPKNVRDGYAVNNVVTVTVCDLPKFGEVLDAAVAAGANQIHGISFGSSKAKEAMADARKAAVADALARAGQLVGGLAVRTGKVLSVTESQSYPRPTRAYDVSASVRTASMDVPVSGGSLSFAATVTVTWELLPGEKQPDPRLPFKPVDLKP
jgi:uncharacterized protein